MEKKSSVAPPSEKEVKNASDGSVQVFIIQQYISINCASFRSCN